MKITVLGGGGWGTALAIVLVENQHEVTLWSHKSEHTQLMKETSQNPMLPGITLPSSLQFTSELTSISESDVIVFAVPSFAIRETAKKIASHAKEGTVIINVSKGIERDSFLRLSQVISSELPQCPVTVLSGPSHAEEVAKQIPTGVVVAANEPKYSNMIQDLFMNPRFRVYTSDDMIGTELCGALKNVMALCAGCCDGLGHGDNTKAMLITRGLAEMARLGVALGAKRETFNGLAGIGDLIVTCTSMHSRNRRFGMLLGEGLTVQQAKDQVGAVVEGCYATETALKLSQSVGVEMPIVQGAYEVLHNNLDSHSVLEKLMSRAKRAEEETIWQA